MRVLVLGPNANRLLPIIGKENLIYETSEPLRHEEFEHYRPDMLLSYGYKHIIPKDYLSLVDHFAMNMHVSLLPWNRGYDPNFWSWIEGTPKGVSLHRITPELDKGPIVAQRQIRLDPQQTLRQTYNVLQDQMCKLLSSKWSVLASGNFTEHDQCGRGTYHARIDRANHTHILTRGWDTPCVDLEKYGIKKGLNHNMV
jgi:methionyl-tRNA formyltransferase